MKVFTFLHLLTISQSVPNRTEEAFLEEIMHDLLDDPFSTGIFATNILRMAFHACFGIGCHGCLNKNDRNNNGLPENLERLYTNWQSNKTAVGDISFADFLNAAAVVSTRILVGEDTVIAGKSIEKYTRFNYGRSDCPTAPFTDEDQNLPNGDKSWGHVYQKFHTDQFGFTEKEIVALIGGGHSVGGLQPKNSGYDQSGWDRTGGEIDQDYFKILTDLKPWTQEVSECELCQGRPQWRVDNPERPDRRNLMMNTDMSMKYNMDNNNGTGFASGECKQDVSKCGKNDEIGTDWVDYFAQDENRDEFLITFLQTYEKMRGDGYKDGELVFIDDSLTTAGTTTTSTTTTTTTTTTTPTTTTDDDTTAPTTDDDDDTTTPTNTTTTSSSIVIKITTLVLAIFLTF